MSKIRKLMGFAAALAFAMVMLPASAFADTSQYDLFVNGEQFTSEKLTIECGEGTATYDPATQTLTLNNASITNTADYGGIRSELTSDLTIALQGSNHITFDDNMGIRAAGNIEIQGPGSLEVNVGGETMDGISVAGNVSLRETNLVVNAPGGIGIASDGTTGGDIHISNSNVIAKSVYPGLFAAGNLTISGASVQSTSTADSALWARGNLIIGDNAHVTLDGKYPTGCGGNFTVYAAEIDAKNTNEENIPALFDNLAIGNDYDLTYAVAVDSEGTTIDLIEHDGVEQAKGYLHLYKNIHFVTGEKSAAYSFPFTKTVKKGGDVAPGTQEFELEIFNVGVGQIEDYTDVTVTATVATNGAGEYEGLLTIQGPKSQVRDITCEGFCVREKNTGVANWTYSDAVYCIFCYEYEIATDGQSATQSSYDIFPVQLVETDNGAFYEKTQDMPVASMTFENVYTEKTAPAATDKPATGDKPAASTKPAANNKPAAGNIPQTGDSSALTIELAVLLMAAGALTVAIAIKKMRKEHGAR